MDSTRQRKVGELMMRDMAGILQTFSARYFKGVLVSVTRVRVTPDLAVARVYLSVFPSAGAEAVLPVVKEHRSQLRHQLAGLVGKQLRKIPDLEFFIDDSLDYLENIDKLLRGEGENPIQ
jgi:ribosome-binding factor A